MTSKEFIKRALDGTTKSDHCSSVFSAKDHDGATVVYSYGYHYPLVKIINGKAFINTQGYSATTAKHISWAMSASAEIVGWDNVFHAPLNRGGGFDPVAICRGSLDEQERLTKQMQAKKRKDTGVYEWLQVQYDRTTATINACEAL